MLPSFNFNNLITRIGNSQRVNMIGSSASIETEHFINYYSVLLLILFVMQEFRHKKKSQQANKQTNKQEECSTTILVLKSQ